MISKIKISFYLLNISFVLYCISTFAFLIFKFPEVFLSLLVIFFLLMVLFGKDIVCFMSIYHYYEVCNSKFSSKLSEISFGMLLKTNHSKNHIELRCLLSKETNNLLNLVVFENQSFIILKFDERNFFVLKPLRHRHKLAVFNQLISHINTKNRVAHIIDTTIDI